MGTYIPAPWLEAVGNASLISQNWPWTLYKSSHDTIPRHRTLEALIRTVYPLALAPLSYLFHHSCTPHCKNFRAFKRGTHTRSSLRLNVGLGPKPVYILVSFGCYHCLPRAARHSYKFTSWSTKHQHSSLYSQQI